MTNIKLPPRNDRFNECRQGVYVMTANWVRTAALAVADLIEERGVNLGWPYPDDGITIADAIAEVVPEDHNVPTLDAGVDGPSWRRGVVLDAIIPHVEFGATAESIAAGIRADLR